MISRIQLNHFDLMAWLKTSLKINWLIVDFQSTGQKVNWYTKSQTLTLWSKLSFKDHISSVDWNSSVNPMILRSDLNYEIRSIRWIWILDIMFQTNKSCIKSKVKDQSFSVKTLILTILPFWWSYQISWGIVIQTW